MRWFGSSGQQGCSDDSEHARLFVMAQWPYVSRTKPKENANMSDHSITSPWLSRRSTCEATHKSSNAGFNICIRAWRTLLPVVFMLFWGCQHAPTPCSGGLLKQDTIGRYPLAQFSPKVDCLGTPADSSIPYFPRLRPVDPPGTPDWFPFEAYFSRKLFCLREPVLSSRPIAGCTYRLSMFQATGRTVVIRVSKLCDSIEVMTKFGTDRGIQWPQIESIHLSYHSQSLWDTLEMLATRCNLWEGAHHVLKLRHPPIYRDWIWIVESQRDGRYAYSTTEWTGDDKELRGLNAMCLFLLSLDNVQFQRPEEFTIDPRRTYESMRSSE